MVQKRFLALFFAVAMVLSLIGCAKQDSAPASGAVAPAAEVKDTINVMLVNEPTILDPQQNSDQMTIVPLANLYESLFTLDDSMLPQLCLAESFEVVDDTTYRVKLLQGVKFHNGEEMKASDAVFSLKRFTEMPAMKSYSSAIDPEGFNIEDDYTFTMKTLTPCAAIKAYLSHYGAAILSEKAVTELGDDFGRNPCGTGPYKFVEWIAGDKVVMEAFEDYHGEKAKIKNLYISYNSESANRVIELESGAADVIMNVPANNVSRIEGNDKLAFYSVPSVTINRIEINNTIEPFTNKLVRQALAYATDKEAINTVVFEGSATVVDTALVPSIPGYNDNVAVKHEYNVEKAKQLLAEAGYADGFTCSISINQNTERQRIATMLQEQWSMIGVTLEIDSSEQSAWLDKLKSGNYQMMIGGLTNMNCDPDTTLGKLYITQKIGDSGVTFTGYSNPAVDELLNAANVEFDTEKRIELYKQVQDIVSEDLPLIPLNVPLLMVGANANLKGLVMRPNYSFNFSLCSF